MYIALDEKQNRVFAEDAQKGGKFYCPICKREVIAKQGEIKLWHFAHKTDELCSDNWHYDMSEWHKRMQSYFPLESREVVLNKNGITHRADVLKDGIVVEFQHSPISSEEFCERNDFYTSLGYKIAWVFDVSEEYKNGNLYFDKGRNNQLMHWKNPKSVLKFGNEPTDFDKQFSIWLYFKNEEDIYDYLHKVIWSSKDYENRSNYKNLIISENVVKLIKPFEIKTFFTTRLDNLISYLSKFKNFRELHNKDICPNTGRFGVKLGKSGCSYCKYCAAVATKSRGDFNTSVVYCCYPKEVNKKLDEPFDGIYYESAEQFYI